MHWADKYTVSRRRIVPSNTHYNWSELTRDNLYSFFYSLGGKIVGKSLTTEQIHRFIKKYVKSALPIRIKKCMDANIKMGLVYMGGCYYSGSDRKKQPAIEVNFSYHPWDDRIKITQYRWQRMSRRFADVMLHEMIHMRQFRARSFKAIPGYQSTAEFAKDRKQQEYYGDRDEMGAFAFNIACELIDRFGYYPNTIGQYLNSNSCTRHKNDWWYAYLRYFDFNHDHKIIRRMKNLVMRQLENAYLGKPFKTNKYLTY